MDRIRKIFKQLLNPSEEICGLDIGSNTIKALLTERDKQGIRLTRFASCPTPPASIKDGAIVDAQALGVAIREIIQENSFP